ncbi:unnamed protein product [Hymenolepis diminuta]|uniref:Uncharacterized protein n=1 Tax=Hymenolepis diminuta TaxID=6216 RepID=A0A564Y303_HYMDI|nr:unnamed protein product [Hymenolepis diminuta]
MSMDLQIFDHCTTDTLLTCDNNSYDLLGKSLPALILSGETALRSLRVVRSLNFTTSLSPSIDTSAVGHSAHWLHTDGYRTREFDFADENVNRCATGTVKNRITRYHQR